MTAVVLRGDARRLPLPDGCVDLVVTSPPYFGLRSYADDGAHYDGQIGSEATPAEWLAALVGCTAEWVRVLKPSGSIFVNLGDKYNSAASGQNSHIQQWGAERGYSVGADSGKPSVRTKAVTDVRPKSLLGLPWRYALACMDELGLILRRDIIWSKPNGLPESVTDRCRSSHEYLFHFTVQPRYYAAVDEIREPSATAAHHAKYAGRYEGGWDQTRTGGPWSGHASLNPLGKLPGSVWNIPSQPLTVPAWLGVDHFAAFPMELPRRCVLGWSPPGVCTACGEGRRPVTQVDLEHVNDSRMTEAKQLDGQARAMTNVRSVARQMATITGYACACTSGKDYSCDGDGYAAADARAANGNGAFAGSAADRLPPTRPALVVDPFGGTGTTALVASMYGRVGLSFDLSADYCRLARWRTADPAERARALLVPKPPPVPDGQASLFDFDGLASA